MIEKTKLANTWPWEHVWIAFAFWVPGISGLSLIYLTYPYAGKTAFWLLGLNVWGLLFAVVYSFVNKRVNFRKQLLADKNLIPCDGIVSFGKMQAPSAIAITPEKIYFAPIVGGEISYELDKIKATEMKTSLPGKHLFFKAAFHMTLENDAVFAFAVNIENAKKIKPYLMPQ